MATLEAAPVGAFPTCSCPLAGSCLLAALLAACSGDLSGAGVGPPGPSGASSAPADSFGMPLVPGAPGGTAVTPTGGVATAAGAGTNAVGSPAGAVNGDGSAPASESDSPGARTGLAARIGRVEYRNSILDVLGVPLTEEELNAASGGIPDDTGDGVFKHFADKQTSTEQHALAYFETAEAVASRVDVEALMAGAPGCADAGPTCGAEVIGSVGRRLFRRPLDEREGAAFEGLFETLLLEDGDMAWALRGAITALLQAPQFLFHVEDETTGTPGMARPVSAHELAARLAAFVWVSVPDDTLLAHAESGALLDESTFASEVERMLGDPKAERFTEQFSNDFSRARWASFEGVTDEVRDALVESMVATFQHHFWIAGRSVADLFTTTEFVLNPTVAELIGAPHSGQGLEVVDVSGLPERIGILTHPASLAGMGDRNLGNFVNRGKYLMERLSCRHPIVFPVELQTEIEAFVADTSGLNERERMEIRKQRAECWLCHQQFEPYAFGFYRFDGAGRYLGETDAAGKPLDLEGWVPIASEENSPHYSNVVEYMQILATEPEIQTCMTEHFVAFATARETDDLAKAQAAEVGAEYQANGRTLSAMIHAVTKTRVFREILVASAGGGSP